VRECNQKKATVHDLLRDNLALKKQIEHQEDMRKADDDRFRGETKSLRCQKASVEAKLDDMRRKCESKDQDIEVLNYRVDDLKKKLAKHEKEQSATAAGLNMELTETLARAFGLAAEDLAMLSFTQIRESKDAPTWSQETAADPTTKKRAPSADTETLGAASSEGRNPDDAAIGACLPTVLPGPAAAEGVPSDAAAHAEAAHAPGEAAPAAATAGVPGEAAASPAEAAIAPAARGESADARMEAAL